MFAGPIHSEKEAGIILESEHKAHLAEIAAKRKEIASRIITYGDDLMQNFNGTGYRFLKAEVFRAVRYNLETGGIAYWNINAWNMDSAYEQFGRTLMSWGKRNYANTGYQPEEYFLFGNDRLLLSSLEVAKPMEDGSNITQAIIGYAFATRIFDIQEGILDADKYNKYWTLLQDRESKKVTFEKCDKDWGRCYQEFDKAVKIVDGDEKQGSRGVMLQGPKHGVRRWSPNEDNLVDPKHWTLKNKQYALIGEMIAKAQPSDFDTMYVPDETTAGFELAPPHYPKNIMFHAMISWKKSKTYTQMYDQRISAKYLKKAIEYYNTPSQWWNLHDRWDSVSVLFADTDPHSSKVVMINEPGTLMNDTRMFQNFGRMV